MPRGVSLLPALVSGVGYDRSMTVMTPTSYVVIFHMTCGSHWGSGCQATNVATETLCFHTLTVCKQVSKAALSLSDSINKRRKARGLQPRPVRAAVIGFPNVGKSALINRFLSRRVCESAPKPGVTKQLRWLRVGGDLDLLDAPGERVFN